MKRYTLRLLVAFLTFAASVAAVRTIRWATDLAIVEQVSTVVKITTFSYNTAEANEVYNTILYEKFPLKGGVKLLVLDSNVTSYVPYENAAMRKEMGRDGSFSKTIRELIPEADTETLDNYHGANAFGGSHELSIPDLNIAIANLSDLPTSDVGAFWSEFYKRYPDSYGIIYFSRVGFNERLDQAFVYVQQSCQDTCGAGSYVLLTKSNGKWHIFKDEVLWIS